MIEINCTTHHNACDCREEAHKKEIEKRDKAIEVMREALDEISDVNNYKQDDKQVAIEALAEADKILEK